MMEIFKAQEVEKSKQVTEPVPVSLSSSILIPVKEDFVFLSSFQYVPSWALCSQQLRNEPADLQ